MESETKHKVPYMTEITRKDTVHSSRIIKATINYTSIDKSISEYKANKDSDLVYIGVEEHSVVDDRNACIGLSIVAARDIAKQIVDICDAIEEKTISKRR